MAFIELLIKLAFLTGHIFDDFIDDNDIADDDDDVRAPHMYRKHHPQKLLSFFV